MGAEDAKTAAELVLGFLAALDQLELKEEDRLIIAPALYTPQPELVSVINQLDAYLQLKNPTPEQQQQAGVYMEQIVLFAFKGLQGYDRLLSYTSPTAQHDLLITGKEHLWLILCKFMRIDSSRRGILVEAKATGGKVNDPQFARLCSIIHFDFNHLIALGAFFTVEGATGFPDRAKRQQKLGDARLRQVIFHAKTTIPIVVFDWDDIKKLVEPGALPTLLERKIADIETLTGLDPCADKLKHVDLPKHLCR
jgi:hypothetical protein